MWKTCKNLSECIAMLLHVGCFFIYCFYCVCVCVCVCEVRIHPQHTRLKQIFSEYFTCTLLTFIDERHLQI